MSRFLPSLFLSVFFAGVAVAFAFGMGRLQGDWLFSALTLAVGLGLAVAPVLQSKA